VCTLIILYKVTEGYPILVAANRDERYGRRSAPPGILKTDPLVWGGRDLEAGGTWLGFNQKGLLVGITNRSTPNPPDPSRRSRGLLCLEALSRSTASEVRTFLEQERGGRYNPFNLFYADPWEAYISSYQDGVCTVSLLPGRYVLTNQGNVNDLSLQRTRTILERLQELPGSDVTLILDTLKTLCRWHGDPVGPRTSPVCVHGDGYGTVSSSIIALGSGKYRKMYLHAEGKPCLVPYHDHASMLGGPLPPVPF